MPKVRHAAQCDALPRSHVHNFASPAVVLIPADFLAQWQGHRRVTRRVIEAFPEDQLFTFSMGGMRTFGELAKEMLGTGNWTAIPEAPPKTKAELLQQWMPAPNG
jgi:hypothetical protein